LRDSSNNRLNPLSFRSGTVLLSHDAVGSASKAVGYGCPLGLLHHHMEFEYLTISIGFLQGLLHWLVSVALELLIPKDNETLSARRMNRFMASCLTSLCFWILAFYNNHISWYSSYLTMLTRYASLFVKRYFFPSTFRPMSLLYIPSALFSAYLGWKAFNTEPELDDDRSKT